MTLLLGLGAILLGLHGRLAHTAPLATNTTRISQHSNGGQANGPSYRADISADGRFVAFASNASNLVAGDHNNARDIFVHDRLTGLTERVSLNSAGVEGNFDSDGPAISDDGRFVVFHSFATNLRSNDTNGVADIFVHDRVTRQTTLVNIVLGGQANDISYDADISGNGQYITFWSFASNLVGEDNNGMADVFRFDRIGQTMFRVSVNSDGVEGNGHSRYPTISQDGRYIAFESDASNLAGGDSGIYRDVFWRDMVTGETKRLSVRHDGQEANGESVEAAISADGRYVAFTSFANDIVPGDNNIYRDIFLRDTQVNTTARVTGELGNVNTWDQPSLSGNGRYITFRGRPAGACGPSLCEVFVHDRQMATTVRASVNNSDVPGNGLSDTPVMAANGRYLAFSSEANNLVINDSNSSRDIFLREFLPAPSLAINHSTGAPGSIFALNGTYYLPGESTQLWVNGRPLGMITADSSGNLNFRLQSQAETDEGAYYVFVQTSTLPSNTAFYLHHSFPTHPNAGSGPLFVLPDGIAFTHFIFLPLATR